MLKGYSEYKDVESNWINKIPIAWSFLPLQSQMKERKEKNDKKQTKFILSLTAALGVIPYSEKKSGGNKAKEDITKYNIAMENDLIVNCMNVVAGSSGISKYYGAISPVYYALHIRNENSNIKYWEYIFRNQKFYSSLVGLGNGIIMKQSSSGKLNTVRKRIPMTKMNRVMLPVPSKSEQDKIVQFLDWKTYEMNRFIHQKKKQIKLLEELKLTRINNLVTKGLTHDVKYKQSNVEWIGEIPEHWDVDHIKQHFKVKKRIAGKEDYDVLSITQQGIKKKDISSNEGQMAQSYANYQFVYPGDFAMNHMDLLTGYIDISKQFGVTSPDYRVFTLSDSEHCFAPFYLMVFQIGYKRKIFYKFGKGAANQGRWRLPITAFYDYAIQVPPIDEQREIARQCDEVEKQINEMISRINKEITLVEELRTKLIFDVVTGQVDVRDVKIPIYEAETDIIDSEDDTDEENLDESMEE